MVVVIVVDQSKISSQNIKRRNANVHATRNEDDITLDFKRKAEQVLRVLDLNILKFSILLKLKVKPLLSSNSD